MASTNGQTEAPAPSVPKNPAMASCRKKKTDDVTFLEDLKDHMDEFIHASMDEHKTCFKKTIQKVGCTIIQRIVFRFALSVVVMHLVLKISVFHGWRRCLGCRRLLQRDPRWKQTKLKLKVLCHFRPVSRSRISCW
jgi:hypothetical protein